MCGGHRSAHRGTHSRGPNPKSYSGRERAFGQQQAASSGRAGEEGPLAAAGREAPQRRGGVGLGRVGIAARMLHAAHGAQDAHAALGRHLKALNKPSGRVRGVWRGGRQGRRPFQALVDGRRARAANSSGARDGARREPQRHHHLPGECPQPGAWPAYHPTGCLAWSRKVAAMSGASRGPQEDPSPRSDCLTAEIRT